MLLPGVVHMRVLLHMVVHGCAWLGRGGGASVRAWSRLSQYFQQHCDCGATQQRAYLCFSVLGAN